MIDSASPQPQAIQSSVFPMLTKPKGFTACTEGPSVAKRSKGYRHGPWAWCCLGWSWKSVVVNNFHPAPAQVCWGLWGGRGLCPSAAGRISSKILKDWIKPNFRWNPGQTSMQHNVMLTWEIVLIVKEKGGGEKKEKKTSSEVQLWKQ